MKFNKIKIGLSLVLICLTIFIGFKVFYKPDDLNTINNKIFITDEIMVDKIDEVQNTESKEEFIIETSPIEDIQSENTELEEKVFNEYGTNKEISSINDNDNVNIKIESIDDEINEKENDIIIEDKEYKNVKLNNNTKLSEVPIASKFLSPINLDFLELGKKNEWVNLQNYLNSSLEKSCGLYFYEDYISYNNNLNGPTIELYKDNDEYVLFLYGILNEEFPNEKETKDKIVLNQVVLESILKLITKDYDELYDYIYEDYEIESIINEKYRIIPDVEFKIKAEVMTNYVIYYIKSK